MILVTHDRDRRVVAWWLLSIAVLIFVMVVVGGATRLTGSGLSMVDWRPVTGAMPPLSEMAWQGEFAKYQTSPEYKLKNIGMSLDDFKGIYMWEWGHRLLGRIIGLAFLFPLIWFWLKNKITSGYKPRLVGLFILGGLQGLLGWYMVMSGLVDEPAVSHYRLTAHLSLALLIFALILWTAFDLLDDRSRSHKMAAAISETPKRLYVLAILLLIMVSLQIMMGGLVAGLKAGFMLNSWPMMGDNFIPFGLNVMEPWWRNPLDNAVTVQFDHRIGAYILVLLALITAFEARRAGSVFARAGGILFASVLLQTVIGIIMLVKVVPVSWGALHQAGGVVVLAAAVFLLFVCHTRKKPNGRTASQ